MGNRGLTGFGLSFGLSNGQRRHNDETRYDPSECRLGRECSVFVATSDDVPGLITEAATPSELSSKLRVMIPELLELNGLADLDDLPELPLVVMHEQVSKIRLRA